MNFAEIKKYDIANGPGIRLSLFVSGCTHHCRGCFNEMTWDFSYGQPFTEKEASHILEELANPAYQGLTLLGGEPMEPQNQRALLPLLQQIRQNLPEKDIWCYTGYLFDRDLCGRMQKELPETKEILSLLSVCVDGPFILEQKDITLLYRGSANQRLIDVPKSLESGRVILWDAGDVSVSSHR